MTTRTQRPPKKRTVEKPDAVRAGEAAAAGLREALARVGIKLPSLWAGEPVNGNAFVELGSVGAGTATRLAEVLTAAADAVPELRAAEALTEPRDTIR